MRAFFLLLVLANLLFYAYANLAPDRGAVESQIPLLQISPDKIKLLGAAGGAAPEKPPAKPPVTTATAAPTVCLEWGVFAGPDVARAENAIARLELPPAQFERVVTDASGYWVHMPPLKTKADADRKVGELKALGVTEFFVVQDATQWRYAISLGIFRTEEAANAFLTKLRERGVRTAVAERRENFLKQIAFYVREPNEATVARLAELQKEFPGSDLKAATCQQAPRG